MTELDDLRISIDLIDDSILNLLAERMRLVNKVGKYKKNHDISALQPERWQHVLKSKLAKAKKVGLDEQLVETLWNAIHDCALVQEKQVKSKKADKHIRTR